MTADQLEGDGRRSAGPEKPAYISVWLARGSSCLALISWICGHHFGLKFLGAATFRCIQSHQEEGFMNERFAGLITGAYQDRRELEWLYSNHLLPHRPRRVVEIGVARGGTTRLFLDLVGPEGQVVGLDISTVEIAPDVLRHPNFKLLVGNSHASDMVARVQALMPECDLLLIDGDHTEAAVLADTACYVPLVREGGLVLWHDVRLESPAGIKGIWYRTLKGQFTGATEHYTNPYNTGFGIWYKRPALPSPAHPVAAASPPVAGDSEKAAVALAQNRLQTDPANPALLLELFEAVDRDPASLRAQVTEALLAAVDAISGRTEWQVQYQDLLARAAPKLSAQLTRLQKWGEVPAFVEQFLDRDPGFAPHGLACLSEGLYWVSQRVHDLLAVIDDYRRVYERCLRDAGDQAEAVRVRLARTLRHERAYETAEAFCARSLKTAPDHFEVRKEQAGALLDAGQREAAHRIFRDLYERRPQDVDVRYQLVASTSRPDDLVIALREEVIALARQLRRPFDIRPETAPSVLDHLRSAGFVLVKGVCDAEALSALDAWAQDRCRSQGWESLDCRAGQEQRRIFEEQMQRSGLKAVADEFLGDWYIHQDAFLEVRGSSAGSLPWHQDARISNAPLQYGTFWLPLDPCGGDGARPGLEIVSYPFRGFCGAAPAKARAGDPCSLNEDLIIPETRWSPVFEPGDLLVFDKCMPHRTQIVPDSGLFRRSLDFRLHPHAKQPTD